MSEDLVPVLVASGLSLERIASLARAAMVQDEVRLTLDAAPADTGLHALEAHAAELAGPLVLLATPIGTAADGQHRLRVRPLHSAQAGELDRFIASILPETPPSPKSPVAERELDAWLQDYLGEEPPAEAAKDRAVRQISSQKGEQLRSFLSSTTLPTLNLVSASTLPTVPGAAAVEEELEDISDFVEVVDDGASTEPPPPPSPDGRDPLLGTVLGGKYKLETVIGKGGMGRVYRAEHIGLGRPMAVKVLHADHAADTASVKRFRREAMAHSRIEHPNVLRVHDCGQDGELHFMVMELLEGRDLRAILDAERILPMERIVAIMTQVCSALAAAHRQGVVHRDVKPANIMITPSEDEEGQPYEHVTVCDFGLAKTVGPQPKTGWGDSSPLTAIGATVGTPDYLSPEQALGEECDPRTDIYTCGAVMYEMTTGRVPFHTAHLMGLLVAVATKLPRPPSELYPGIDRGLEAVILKALSKNRGLRQQTAQALRGELSALIPGMSGRHTTRRFPPAPRG
jgi:hypothetical protein